MNCRRQRFLAHWRASPADGRPRAVSAYRPPNECYGYNPPSSWSRRRNGDRWRGDERRNLGSILRADADRVDRFRLAVVEDCRRKGPIHSSACIDVAAVVAHVRHRLLRIKIERRRMTVDNVFWERPTVTKEAVANP